VPSRVSSRAATLGRPVHPVIIGLPLGILTSAVLADVGALLSGVTALAPLARADLAVGVVAAVFALCVLLVALMTAPAPSPARAVLNLAAAAYISMIMILTTVWTVRIHGAGRVVLLLLELVGLATGLAAGRLVNGLARARVGAQSRTASAAVPAGREVSLAQLLR
jgi:uncharacterized membrane protein